MDTIVMKFGGSSVADNDKLKLVAKKLLIYIIKKTILLLFYLPKEKQQIN